MQARGPLMVEHRWIEKMLEVIRRELDGIGERGEADPCLIDEFVDFLRSYADRTHHGKEEDILFRELAKKEMSGADRQAMNELIEEHRFARETTDALAGANRVYRGGDESQLPVVIDRLGTLVDFYPEHIRKEDDGFFPAAREYMTSGEERYMVMEFREFDRKMIHDKYRSMVRGLEEGR